VLAIDFERVQRLVSASIPRRLEQSERAVVEVAQERTSIVDADFLDLARCGVRSFLDEGLGHRRDVGDSAVEPDRRVDAVRQQVARYAAAGRRDVQSPQPVAASRPVGGDRPVLQKVGAVVEDAAELSLVDQLLREGDGRDAAIVVPNGVCDFGCLNRSAHLLALGDVHCQRLFTKNHLSVRRTSQSNLLVQIVWNADVDGIDVFPLDQLSPVGLR